MNTTHPPAILAWSIWGFGGLLFMIGFFQRVAPAVLSAELMVDFGLGAGELGALSAFYFYSYAAMQIPTGFLADTLGPRRLLAAGAMVAALGTLCFGLAPGLFWAKLGRFLIGASVAVAFVSMMKLSSHWMAARHFALATGLAQFIGVMGAVLAGAPLSIAASEFGWRSVMVVSAGVTFLLALLIWMVVRDDPEESGYSSFLSLGHQSAQDNAGNSPQFKQLLQYRNLWLLTLIPGGIVGCVITFSGLWGVPFLISHYAMPRPEAAFVNSSLLVSWAISGPLFGWYSDRIGRRKPLYVIGCGAATLCWAAIIFVPNLPFPALFLLLCAAGFCSGSMIIGFAFIKESVPLRLSGTAAGVCNMGVMMGPMLLQPLTGLVLDHYWSGEIVNGVKSYGLMEYQAGFSLMLIWIILSFILIFLTKETYCQPLEQSELRVIL